jgi:hypothetical protein
MPRCLLHFFVISFLLFHKRYVTSETEPTMRGSFRTCFGSGSNTAGSQALPGFKTLPDQTSKFFVVPNLVVWVTLLSL